MKIYLFSIILVFSLLFGSFSLFAADLLPGGTNVIRDQSIIVSGLGGVTNVEEVSRDFGLKILSAFKIIVSGIALIYIVLIGVFMVISSENEDNIKSQKKQFIYALVGFLFLNIPGLLYALFFGPTLGTSTAQSKDVGTGLDIEFWDATSLLGANGYIPMFIGFFEIFIFGIAILLFTWGFFRLILSGGDEEVQKKAKGRIVYGIIGLIFLGFVKIWSGIISRGQFFGEIATVGNKILGLALYFAAPVVILFLVIGAYYFITSAGDEERIKKAKTIFINTLIASLILVGAYSFLSDLVGFTI